VKPGKSNHYHSEIEELNINPEFSPLDMGWDTATFEMPPGLTREDVHVGFSDSWSAERITVSWQYITTEQFVEDGKLIREKRLRNYHRTLPLPKGVQVR
jgi:hypothetical protein